MDAPTLNRNRVDAIARDARTYRLLGWGEGSSFRCHPCWVRRGRFLIVSHWHVSSSCHIALLTDPEATVRPGHTDSRYDGDPWPVVDKGQLVTIWSGNWNIRGPWEPDIVTLLDGLEEEIAAARSAIEESKRLASEQHEAQRLEREAALRQQYQSAH